MRNHSPHTLTPLIAALLAACDGEIVDDESLAEVETDDESRREAEAQSPELPFEAPAGDPSALDYVTLTFGDLSPVYGGSGGNWFDMSCGPGGIAVGIRGRAASGIDRLGLICQKLYINGSLGPDYYPWFSYLGYYVEYVGGWGGSDFSRQCAQGYAIANIDGRSATYVDQLKIQCRAVDVGYSYELNPVGGGGGEDWANRPSYAGRYVTALYGRAGTRLDAIQILRSSTGFY